MLHQPAGYKKTIKGVKKKRKRKVTHIQFVPLVKAIIKKKAPSLKWLSSQTGRTGGIPPGRPLLNCQTSKDHNRFIAVSQKHLHRTLLTEHVSNLFPTIQKQSSSSQTEEAIKALNVEEEFDTRHRGSIDFGLCSCSVFSMYLYWSVWGQVGSNIWNSHSCFIHLKGEVLFPFQGWIKWHSYYY